MLLPFLDPAPWRVVAVNPTGRYGRSQLAGLRAAGTNVIAGVALGRGGEDLDGVKLYDTVAEVRDANVAILYTPPDGARDAVGHCIAAGIKTIITVAEYVPVHDALEMAARARAAGCWLVGPNTLGICVPGRGLLGSLAPSFCRPGRVAMITRSGTLTLTVVKLLSEAGIGQSVVVNMGGDTVIGRNPDEYLRALAAHDGTDAVLYCGEIGGDKEYAFADAARGFPKPIVTLIVGRHAPAERRMGHAGALIGSARETAAAKLAALAEAGCHAVRTPDEAIAVLTRLSLATPP
jgi:succinyl-CoA synthetase alpha subunit